MSFANFKLGRDVHLTCGPRHVDRLNAVSVL